MTWCTKSQVAKLIQVGRLDPYVSQEERRVADLQFIDVCQNAINIGDVLVGISLDSQFSQAIRLTCALAVQPMVNVWSWKDGNRFSDKDLLSSGLVQYFNNTAAVGSTSPPNSPLNTDPRNLVRAILRFFAKIIALDFYSDHWSALLLSIGEQALQTGGYGLELLVELSSIAKTNPTLWRFLVTDVLENKWLDTLRFYSPFRASGFEMVFNLVRLRCKTSEEREHGITAETCFVLRSDMSQYMMAILNQQIQDAAARTATEGDRLQYFRECEWILQLSHRLVKSKETALVVFNAGSFFLINLQALYMSELPVPSAETVRMAESALGCIQDILMTFPEGEYQSIMETLDAVVMYMVRASVEDGASAEVELLSEMIMEDEAVPVGCGGDDVPSLAGSILELFLEAHPDQCVRLITCLFDLASQVEQKSLQRCAAMNFLANAVIHISRVSISASQCLAEEVPPETQFFPKLFDIVLAHLDDTYIAALFLHGIAQCFFHCKSEALLTLVFQFLETVLQKQEETAAVMRQKQTPETTVVTLPLSALVTHAMALIWENVATALGQQYLRESTWILAVEGAAFSSSQLSFFCFAFSINTMMQLQPTATLSMANELHHLVPMIVSNFCQFSTTRAVPNLLYKFLLQLLNHCPTDQLCGVLQQVVVDRAVTLCSDFKLVQVPLLLRQMALVLLDSITSFVAQPRGKSKLPGRCCHLCCFHMLTQFLPLLTRYAAEMGPFDEGTSRTLSSSLAVAVVVGKNASAVTPEQAPIVFHSTCQILSGCASEHHSAPTLSNVCSALALQSIAYPGLLDGDFTPLFLQVFCPRGSIGENSVVGQELIVGRKGVNYLGAIMLLSLKLIRAPVIVHQVLSTSSEGNPASAAWLTALSWSSSLAPFTDTTTWSYILTGWVSLITYVMRLPQDQQTLLMQPHSLLTVYVFPSIFAQKMPSKWLSGLNGILDTIIVGLVLCKHLTLRAAPVSGFRAELHHLISVPDVFPHISGASSESLESLGLGPLLNMSRIEAAGAVLQQLSQVGFASLIEERERMFASK